jgi:hypothetical protein
MAVPSPSADAARRGMSCRLLPRSPFLSHLVVCRWTLSLMLFASPTILPPSHDTSLSPLGLSVKFPKYLIIPSFHHQIPISLTLWPARSAWLHSVRSDMFGHLYAIFFCGAKHPINSPDHCRQPRPYGPRCPPSNKERTSCTPPSFPLVSTASRTETCTPTLSVSLTMAMNTPPPPKIPIESIPSRTTNKG